MEKQQLQEKERSPQILLLDETWLTRNDPLIHSNISGYQTTDTNPRKTSIPGVGTFYAKTGAEYEVLECESELESLVGSYTFNKFERKIFCAVYRLDAVHLNKFIDLLVSLLGFLRSQKINALALVISM